MKLQQISNIYYFFIVRLYTHKISVISLFLKKCSSTSISHMLWLFLIKLNQILHGKLLSFQHCQSPTSKTSQLKKCSIGIFDDTECHKISYTNIIKLKNFLDLKEEEQMLIKLSWSIFLLAYKRWSMLDTKSACFNYSGNCNRSNWKTIQLKKARLWENRKVLHWYC